MDDKNREQVFDYLDMIDRCRNHAIRSNYKIEDTETAKLLEEIRDYSVAARDLIK